MRSKFRIQFEAKLVVRSSVDYHVRVDGLTCSDFLSSNFTPLHRQGLYHASRRHKAWNRKNKNELL